MNLTSCVWVSVVVMSAMLCAPAGRGAPAKPEKNEHSRLNIERQGNTGKLRLSWTGKGVLKSASSFEGHFKPVPEQRGEYLIEPTEELSLYRLEGPVNLDYPSNVVSINIVGYVNVVYPPGLTLSANPLLNLLSNAPNTVSLLFPTAPDGMQVFKYNADVTFEVSTFDGASRSWSNPNMELWVGTGFYVSNPTSLTITQTFVGEVLLGHLVNPLPAGFSTKGSLVPQAGSINSIHGIPGEPGDQLSLYVNDLQGGGQYVVSVFDQTEMRWVPDQDLRPAQGFWIQKQRLQYWIRDFYPLGW
jgi:hypothetical protein